MKTRAIAIICLAAVSTFGATVTFNLRDFITTTQPLVRRTVELIPQSTPLSDGGTNLIISERRYFNTGTAAEFTATNMIEGLYMGRLYGPTYTSVFRINVPAGSTNVNASDILVSGSSTSLETEDGRTIDLE